MTITIAPNGFPIDVNLDFDGISGIDGIIAIARLCGIGDLDEASIKSQVVRKFEVGSSERHNAFLFGDTLVVVFRTADENGNLYHHNSLCTLDRWSERGGGYNLRSYEDMKEAFYFMGFIAIEFYDGSREGAIYVDNVFEYLCTHLNFVEEVA